MDWGKVVNLVVTSLGFGAAAFMASAFAMGLPTKQALGSALLAGAIATINHIRQSPLQ